ncbi:DUF2075 domain-containing protein [Campylobacter concisus]|uniref:DNA/RNA helicase domain-containing protein n=1 Tax=Campylobacter concisus TaxID=199 RepID=UPI0018A9F534|nr:DNA/RNA helicase domain-containing protein [Campylobacter concisus]QPH99830.1 DUF2075 domain-containing protein [Campylobacter concisus]QPI01622.1 DUF2075 domain-containing protein [Campylobacter concisus]
MKSTNIDSLIQIFDSKNKDLCRSLFKLVDGSFSFKQNKGMSDSEVESICSFFMEISSHLSHMQKEGYFISTLIETGIREEFDILRFSDKSVLNIEVKREPPKNGISAIKDQLIRHNCLLRLLNKDIVICAYIAKTKQIYLLEDNELKDIDFLDLSKMIPEDYVIKNELLSIDQSSLIISPYSQPQEFKNHKYFLTSEQNQRKNDILKTDYKKICLAGGPGTGKSLLLMDLAREYILKGNKVLIVFCALIPEYESLSNELGITIVPIKGIIIDNLKPYDVILIDEAQRLYENQFKQLINLSNKMIVFSTDHQQTLHRSEKTLNVEEKLKDRSDVLHIRLKNKIRTNIFMASFISKFLNTKTSKAEPYDYDKVQVVYFSNKNDAMLYIKEKYSMEHYVSIELTEYTTKSFGSLKREKVYTNSRSTHSVIGREYENVLVVLDKHFKYSEEGKLVSTYNEYYPYDEHSCIFEALTRVKSNLLLVVIDNPELFIQIQKILSWKNDKLYSD